VAGANDDDDYTSDHEEAKIKFSFPDRKSMKKISDEELLVIVSKGIACLPSCGTMSCDCLDILSDVNVRECVAQFASVCEEKQVRPGQYWFGMVQVCNCC